MSISTPRFNFFDKEILKDPENNAQNFDKFKEVDVSCSSAGRGQIVIGDREGTVYILSKGLDITGFRAYNQSISHLHQLRQNSILFTIGYDSDCDMPLCKVWLMDRVDLRGTPHCSRIIKLSSASGNKDIHHSSSEVTCMAAHENLQLLAIGFKSGAVMLYRGDVTKDRQSKLSVVIEEKPFPSGTGSTSSGEITGLAIRVIQRSQLLFISTSNSLLSYEISSKDRAPQVLENYGCAARCAALSDDLLSNQLLVGRNDGVHYIQSEGRGGTAPLEGEKYQVHWYRGYIVTVGKSNISRDMDIVTIYDALNKFIAYSGPIPHVSNILFEWNSIYVLGGDNKLYMLLEKATQTKLEILFKKNQYITAINIAKSQQYDNHGLVDIFRLYGDYLYTERGDHDGAIEQYIKTIGKLEPSYVIRKFLDAQRLHNLTAYLEELHRKQYATEDHTTLLLNCYTKLKDQHKLDTFIQMKNRNNEVNFDIETAIRVLRQADYHSHALQLAERHYKHEWYMKIQLENVKDFASALRYMKKLSFDEAEDNLKKYGKVLIQTLPSETTSLLKKLCLGQYNENRRARPDEFIHIFVNNSTQLTEFLEAMINSEQPAPAAVVYNTLLELYLQSWANVDPSQSEERAKQSEKTMTLLKNCKEHYARDQALVLCHMQKFEPGILYLYEQGRLYQQIVRRYMEHNDYDNVIAACKKWGDIDSDLWVMALSYFARERDQDLKLQMKEVLRNIDEQKLLPPLLVIQTLARSETCTLGVVKDFIMDRLLTENDRIEKDEKLIKQYIDDTQSLRSKIEDLKTKPQVFQASRCTVCKYQLELPSIHFLCQHSYHTHCFESYAETENECPACLEDNRKIVETIKQQEKSKDSDLAKRFTRELRESRDGFNVVAEYYGKGVFNKVTLLAEPPSPVRDDVTDPFLTSPAAVKVGGAGANRPRRNPFAGGPTDPDKDSAGTFRRSDSRSSAAENDDFPLYRETSKPAPVTRESRRATGQPLNGRVSVQPTAQSGYGTESREAMGQSAYGVESRRPMAQSSYGTESRGPMGQSSYGTESRGPMSQSAYSGEQTPYRHHGPTPSSTDDRPSSQGFSDGSSIDVISIRPKQLATKRTPPASDTRANTNTPLASSAHRTSSVTPSISVSAPRGNSTQQQMSSSPIAKGLSSSPSTRGPGSVSASHSLTPGAGSAKGSRSGHTRQSSAGKILESGLSFIKGHIRQSSDQSSKPAGQTSASNPFIDDTRSSSYSNSKQKSASSTPFDKPALNPFEQTLSNPFEETAANPFEGETSQSIRRSKASYDKPANPFMEPPSTTGSNPFEEENKNPFE